MVWIDASKPNRTRLPSGTAGVVQILLVALIAAALASALVLTVIRGPALLIDLSQMAAGFICF